MTDFAALRRAMVQGQVRINDVTEPRLTSALLELPRERFVPAPLSELAYLDRDLPLTGPEAALPRCLLKPLTLAKLIQAAEVVEQDRVLDVGCATGYAAAVLAHLGGRVVALEEQPDLARAAERNLAELGLASVSVAIGPLVEGWEAQAPYDIVLIEGRIEMLPPTLAMQLAPGGRLVCVHGEAAAAKGMIYLRNGTELSGRPIFEAAGTALAPGFVAPPAFVF
jgi:protein-L-isoaspartate(D-aspartate) O-methyltransferase